MPLPEPGSPWPPPGLSKALDQFRVWDAWWAGSPDLLADVYGGTYGGGFMNRPSQYAGGVAGFLSRMWWGRPTPQNEPEEKLHVPLAGDLCRTAADMLFSEPLKATADDTGLDERLEDLLDDTGQSKLIESAETVAALGGAYLRPVYDKTISDRAWFDTVAPDSAIPCWRWGRLAEVTFWRTLRKVDGKVWRHLEHHVPGWIVHALFEGDESSLGLMVPLLDHPHTAGYALLVNEAGAIETGYPMLDVTYIPHALPNRMWRTDPLLAPMGRSVLDGCEPLLDALDMTYSSWMRDIDLGRGRVIVPGTWLDDHGPGRGATFDPNRRWFAPVPGALKMDRPEVVQFSIRVQEHHDTSQDLIERIIEHAGYAAGSVGVVRPSGGMKTATEVTSDERRSFITRGRQIGYWRPALAERALPALLAVDAYAFGRPLTAMPEVHVEFADSVQEDPLTVANTVKILHDASAASVDTMVRMVNPEWSEPEVQAEVARIKDGAAPAIAAPFDYGTGAAPTETDDQRGGEPGEGQTQ